MMVRIVISEGVEYSKQITEIQAGKIIAFIGSEAQGLEDQSVSVIPLSQEEITQISTHPSSPREALAAANASTNAQQITVFAYYLSDKKNQSEFTGKELKDMFKKVGEPTPKNFGRDLQNALRLGYMFEEGGKFCLTERGREAVGQQFKEKRGFIASKRAGFSSQKRINKKSVQENITSLEIVPSLEGFPDYHSLKVKGHRILWLLAFADLHGIKELSTRDIEYLANRLKDVLLSRDFSSLNTVNIKSGYATVSSAGLHRILQRGIDFLKNQLNTSL